MKRKVLLITVELPPLPGLPVSGGGLRVHGIAEGLRAAGHEVIVSAPLERVQAAGKAASGLKAAAHDPKDLGPLIVETRPDVLLFEQWGTATHLPDVDLPTVFDLHGALSLENAHRSGGDVASDALTKIETLQKADLITCPGVYQRNYFLSWWILAGADPKTARVEVVPVCLSPDLPRIRKTSTLRFVYSGTAWPWIDPFPGLEILAKKVAATKDASLDLYVGAPAEVLDGAAEGGERRRYDEIVKRTGGLDRVTVHEPIGHEALLKEYRSCAAAFDLYARNPERELAYTTRTVEYLWSGVPVIYGNYGELAPLIEKYGAGIVVDPADGKAIEKAVDGLFAQPGAVIEMAKNAQRLVRENLTWDVAVKPLAAFVDKPRRRKRAPSLVSGFKSVMDAHWEKLHSAKVAELEARATEDRKELLARLDRAGERLDEAQRAHRKELEALRDERAALVKDKDARIEKLVDDRDEAVAKAEERVRALNERIDELNRSYGDKLWQQSQERDALQKQKEEEARALRDEWQARVKERDGTIKEINARIEKQADEFNQRIWSLTEQAKADASQAERQAEKAAESHSAEIKKREEQIARLEAKFDETDRNYQEQIQQLGAERREQVRAKDEELRLLREARERDVAQRDADLRQAREENRVEIEKRDAIVAEKNKKLDEVQRTWEQRLSEVQAERREQLAQKDREIEKAWADRHREVEQRDQQIAKLQDRVEEAHASLEKEKSRSGERFAELERLRGETERLERELADTRKWGEKLEPQVAELGEVKGELARVETELRDTRKWAQDAEARAAETERLRADAEKNAAELRDAREWIQSMEIVLNQQSADLDRAKSETGRLETELADTRAWAETIDEDYRSRLGALGQSLQDQEAAFAESEETFNEMERIIDDQREHIAFLGKEIERIQSESARHIRKLESDHERQSRLLNEFDQVRRELEGSRRALALETQKSGSVARRKIRRKGKKLFRLYPRLAWLFTVNLLTNVYMEKWQKKHGKQIFPGHVKAKS